MIRFLSGHTPCSLCFIFFICLAVPSLGQAEADPLTEALLQRDIERAKKIYLERAENGDAEAAFQLGVAHMKGRMKTETPMETIKWFKQAAEQGHVKAQSTMATLYLIGTNLFEKDERIAFEWMYRAAYQGDKFSRRFLGQMYFDGTGTTQNIIEGFAWIYLAAMQNEPNAKEIIAKVRHKSSYAEVLAIKNRAAEIRAKIRNRLPALP